MENKRHEKLTDKLSIHIFELPKIPEEINSADDKQMWLRLIKADNEEALKMVKTNTQNPMIHEAIGKIKELNADAIFREQIRQRDKALRDYENDITVSRLEGEAIGEARGIGIGRAEGIGIGRAEGIGIGRAEGEAKKLVDNVLKFMKGTGKSLEEVLDILEVTKVEYDQSLALLNQ